MYLGVHSPPLNHTLQFDRSTTKFVAPSPAQPCIFFNPPFHRSPANRTNPAYNSNDQTSSFLTGKPNPTMRWYKEGSELDSNTNEDILISFDSGLGLAVLVIKQVAPKDAGRYTCVARNALGSCSTSASVNVQGFLLFLQLECGSCWCCVGYLKLLSIIPF